MPFFGQYWAYFVPVLMLATAAWYLAILWLLWRIARALERRPLWNADCRLLPLNINYDALPSNRGEAAVRQPLV